MRENVVMLFRTLTMVICAQMFLDSIYGIFVDATVEATCKFCVKNGEGSDINENI